MNRDLFLWQFGGFVFAAIGGTLLHFLYDWTGKNILLASFSAVNESTWEHMKLLFFPLFIFALIQSRFFKSYHNFWCVKLVGILVGLTPIPILFYTINGVFGKSPDWINISIFFVSAAVTFLLETGFFKKENFKCNSPWIAFVTICLICVLFIIFTFITPKIPLFQDPLTKAYGLN